MFIASPTLSQLLVQIQQMAQNEQDIFVLLFAEETVMDYPALIKALNEQGIRFFGGFFPGIIHNGKKQEKGVLLLRINAVGVIHIIHDTTSANFDSQQIKDSLSEDKQKSALILVDGLSSKIASFLNHFYNTLGHSFQYLGAGCGSLSLEQKPCLITQEGMLENAAVVCFIDLPMILSIKHGWQSFYGPLIATKTKENIIYELNWKPAFEVYKEIIETLSGYEIEQDNFFEVAKAFPFGMLIEGQEDIVRDPIATTEEGALVCVGEVNSNTVLQVLKGDAHTLIEASEQAALDITQNSTNPLEQIFVVDCISRVLFLQEEFPIELERVQTVVQQELDYAAGIDGVLSLGEISSSGNGMLHFYNKTMVIGAFEKIENEET